MISYWVDSTSKTNYPKLDSNLSTDVCIIGGGMTGLATAYMLKDSGLKVTLLEASEIGMGVTANTTAKITSQHHLFYKYLLSSYYTPGSFFCFLCFGGLLFSFVSLQGISVTKEIGETMR